MKNKQVRISRLRKKSSEMIDLYHVTSSQNFMEIVNSGQVSPSSVTGITSNGLSGEDSPSGSINGIYLANDRISASENYGYGAIDNSIDSSLPNIAMILHVSVPTDNLLPDYDDWSDEGENDGYDESNLWRKCLEEVGQCVFNGSIDISSIKKVEFDREIKKSGNLLSNSDIVNNITFGSYISVSQAYSEIEYLYSLARN